MVIPLCIVGLIAGTDGLFLRAVPLEQRLISHNDDIRKKAQQALLGQSSEQKQQTVRRLIPALIQADPLARKWAAISFALVGPSAREAIPSLLQNVSDKETEVAQAARVALTEIGAPDAGQLPILIQALGNAHEGVRCEAAASIARLGSNAEPALPALFQALENKTSFPDCFVSTLVDLNSFIPGIETDLASRLHSANPVLLDHTLQVVQRLPVKSPPTLQLLLDVLSQNENEDIRQQAAEALSLRHAPEKGVPAALKACATLSANAQVRALAFSLFRKQSPPLPLAQKVILHALHDEDAGLRRSALEWLITQPTWTRSFAADLFQELHDPLPDHRRLALEALYHVAWHGRDHVQTIALMQRDHEADIRCLAVRQLVDGPRPAAWRPERPARPPRVDELQSPRHQRRSGRVAGARCRRRRAQPQDCRTCLSETAGAARTRHGFSSDHDPDPLHRRRAGGRLARLRARRLVADGAPGAAHGEARTAGAARPRTDHRDAGDPGEQSKRSLDPCRRCRRTASPRPDDRGSR